jgi:hypothetical protein
MKTKYTNVAFCSLVLLEKYKERRKSKLFPKRDPPFIYSFWRLV